MTSAPTAARFSDGLVAHPPWLPALGGLVLAVVTLLSAVTVWATIAIVLIVATAVRGRTGLERRLILGVIGIAIVVRVAIIAGLFLSSDHVTQYLTSFPFDGDGVFMKTRSLWIRNIWLGVPVAPHEFEVTFDTYGWTGYFLVIAYLQYLLGPAPYAIHLFNVCCFVAGAVLIHRTVRPSYGAVAALVALVAILFMPTPLLWSVSALKESLHFLLMAIVVFGLMKAARGEGWVERLAGLGCAVAAAAALSSVRAGALFIVTTGFAVALVGAFLTRRVYLLMIVLALASLLGSRVLESPSLQSRVLPKLADASVVHIGNVHTPGHGYKLLDQRFYSGDPLGSMTWPEAERFVARALVSFVTVPLPQDVVSRSELLLIPQQVLWYSLLVFAVPGVFEGCRRDTFLTWLLLGFTFVGAGVIVLNNGNVGTFVRIRDTVVPFVSCLAAVGAVSVLARVFAGRAAVAHSPSALGTHLGSVKEA